MLDSLFSFFCVGNSIAGLQPEEYVMCILIMLFFVFMPSPFLPVKKSVWRVSSEDEKNVEGEAFVFIYHHSLFTLLREKKEERMVKKMRKMEKLDGNNRNQ